MNREQQQAMFAKRKIETKHTKFIKTPHMGNMKTETIFKGTPNFKMTKPQARVIKEFIDNHTRNPKYVPSWLFVHTDPHFSGASVAYFPKDAHNTLYTEHRKTIWVGKKGGIRKFVKASPLGKDVDVKGLERYYFKPEET